MHHARSFKLFSPASVLFPCLDGSQVMLYADPAFSLLLGKDTSMSRTCGTCPLANDREEAEKKQRKEESWEPK